MNKVCNRLLGIGVVIATTTSFAHADTVSDTQVFGSSTLPISSILNLATFDTGLGTLTGIQLELSVTYTGNITIFNPTNGPLNVNSALAETQFTATGPDTTNIGPVPCHFDLYRPDDGKLWLHQYRGNNGQPNSNGKHCSS